MVIELFILASLIALTILVSMMSGADLVGYGTKDDAVEYCESRIASLRREADMLNKGLFFNGRPHNYSSEEVEIELEVIELEIEMWEEQLNEER